MWPGFGSRESDRSLSLQFSSTEIARWVPGYPASGADAEKKLLGGLFAPTEPERAEQQSNKRSMHHDIWYALGDYRARTVEPIAGTRLFRLYPVANGPTWMVVTRVPDVELQNTHLQDDFWIATCSFVGPEQTRRCSLDIDVATLSVSLEIAEADLPRRQELATQVVQKLKTWQVPCAG